MCCPRRDDATGSDAGGIDDVSSRRPNDNNLHVRRVPCVHTTRNIMVRACVCVCVRVPCVHKTCHGIVRVRVRWCVCVQQGDVSAREEGPDN
jgi:hypothetical protein